MFMDPGMSVDQLIDLVAELLRRNGYREDAYVRPTLYKSTEAIGVRLHNLDCRLNMFAIPFVSTSRSIGGSARRRSPGGATATSRSRRGPRSSART